VGESLAAPHSTDFPSKHVPAVHPIDLKPTLLFYGVEGMRVGGTHRLEIALHLAYRDRGFQA
jgi:hypothetical protein